MTRHRMTCICLLAFSGINTGQASPASDSWSFRVYLDDRPIGIHTFQRSNDQNGYRVYIKATFDVSFMFINVYSYRHENTEYWQDGCLTRLSSHTDDDGQTHKVRLEKAHGHSLIRSTSGDHRIKNCVRSFAYWNPDLLKAPRLLNAQTGELVDVRLELVSEPDDDNLHYRLTGDSIDIRLRYSPEGDWLGLQSRTVEGYTLRYILMENSS